jgi:hypothetical protein
MGQMKSVDGSVSVVAVPSFRLTINPASVEIHKDDSDMVAKFTVGIVRDEGFTAPVYLRLAGIAGLESFSINPIPADGSESILSIDMTDQPVGNLPFTLVGSEDDPDV